MQMRLENTQSRSLLKLEIKPWIATMIACLCAFMVVMDGAIVNIALADMQLKLGLSLRQTQWVVDSYLLLLGGFMLLAAKASDLYGRRKVLLWGLGIFTAASLLGGLADSANLLITARAIQGFAAAALATSPLAIIMAVHHAKPQQERAIGYWAACAAMGSAFGVVIGGIVTYYFGWRWVMLLNIPIGVFLWAVVYGCFNAQSKPIVPVKLDILGAISSTLAIAGFLYAISAASHLGWQNPALYGVFALSCIAFMVFIWVQLKSKYPLIPLTIFKLRNVAIGMLMVMALGVTLTTPLYFLSLFLQNIAWPMLLRFCYCRCH